MKVATGVKTEDWNRIIRTLTRDGWKVRSKYAGIDAGIDNDFLILSKGAEQIRFGWTNYFEGEIKCSDSLLEYLSEKFGIKFIYGDAVALMDGYFEQKEPAKIFSWVKKLFKK
ncbi:hypothetical protein [Niabella hibiscisoli]|uniref:hypothetical protein n=1 Tax=Niabella hibiscisoli TaxID=1825928 RepID=UPI001F116C67|nr:hypothetical protein [Niabella hibiscisoli]MCH5721202.1 hypothetical protein [Niabella hibiscisoli]